VRGVRVPTTQTCSLSLLLISDICVKYDVPTYPSKETLVVLRKRVTRLVGQKMMKVANESIYKTDKLIQTVKLT